jgi:type IV pilus assembly protein PilQ
VKGSLTIVLDEVPWDQALDIVLQNNGLDKQLSGNVLRIATRDTMKKEAETQRDLERAQAEAVAPVTVTRVLSYGKADKMKDTLKKFLSQRGDLLSDDRSNQLIIRDIPSVIPVIDNLIRQLDRKSQQVEIEARVVSASRSFAQDIGVQLGFAGTATGGRSVIAGDPTVGTSTTTTSPIPPPFISGSNGSGTPLPLNVNLGAGAPTSGLFLGHRSPNFAVDFFITAAESKGVGKLLSKPRVVTQNNEKAIIKQGQKIPIQTTINNTISVQFIDAVLKLEVTPQITKDGTVFMDVLVENTTIDPGIPRIQGVPALDTQSEETKILVEDGGTVVVGGIIVSSQNTSTTEVPLLGSLPLIGHLFKRNNVTISSQELLFFLTPRIIPG